MENLTLKEQLRALDQMSRSVTSEEADLIEVVSSKLKKRKKPTPDEIEKIGELYWEYFEKDEDEEKDPLDLEPEDDLDDTDL